MLKCFEILIGRTVKAYVDDIVVKSKWNGIKLNPEKCVFGVPRGMLLRFIMSD
jgi:hypothetical protein